jgi:hypothetical protein
VLSGVYDTPDDLDFYVRELLEELHMPDAIKTQCNLRDINLSMETYRSFWSKANTNTSCYPGALSFATLKAGSYDDIISHFECAMTRIPIKSGYSSKLWRWMLDVMIMKKAGLTDLSNLRTIVIFSPDCNYAFKHIGREMMAWAKLTGSLALEQYGSRKV